MSAFITLHYQSQDNSAVRIAKGHIAIYWQNPNDLYTTVQMIGASPFAVTESAEEIDAMMGDVTSSSLDTSAELAKYRAIRKRATDYLNGNRTGSVISSAMELLHAIERITP